MFKLTSFKSDAVFWPLAHRSDHAPSRSILSSVVSGPRSVLAVLAKKLSVRRAAQALTSLDDRMLRDIGLDRSQIGSVVRRGRHAATPHEVRDDISRWG